MTIFVAIYGIAFYYAKDFIDGTKQELAEKLVLQQLQLSKERTLQFFARDQKLIETGIVKNTYQNWMKSPSDERYRKQAIQSIEVACQLVDCFGWFLFALETGEGYSYNKSLPTYKRDDFQEHDRAWFDPLMASGKTVLIDSSYDVSQQIRGVFMDYVIREDGRLLGIVGTYANLDTVMDRLLTRQEKSVVNILVDEQRSLRFSQNLQSTASGVSLYNSFAHRDWQSLLSENIRTRLLQIAKANSGETLVLRLPIAGNEYVVGISYIDQVEWFAISMYQLNVPNERFDTLQMAVVSLMILLLFIALTLLGLYQQIIWPVDKLNNVVGAIRKGNFTRRAEHVGSDVIQSLGQHIDNMADKISMQLQALKTSNEALKAATHKAEKANEAKSLFLSSMSHEMRTPLNAVIGFTQFAQEADTEATRVANLKKAESAGNHLLQVVNDLLDLNKLEMDDFRLECTPFKPRQVLTKVLAISNLKAKAKQLPLTFHIDKEIPKILIGDPLRVEQILLNLIGNAIKFTEKGKVNIALKLKERRGDKVILEMCIEDTGIGISNEQLTRLFKPFSQADESITRKYGGTGLGLTIVKQLVELMDGEMSVQSALGLGTSFVARIPFAVGEEVILDKTVESAAELDDLLLLTKALPVLLVEDNEINQEIAKGILAPLQMDIDVASNGAEGVTLFKQKDYHLILMDIQMPVMDGFTATRQIRQCNEMVSIIGLSAHGTKQDAEKAIASGMNAYQTKPINKQALWHAIYQQLHKNTG